MRRYTFPDKHSIVAESVDQFLEGYAEMNASPFAGHLLGVDGGKTLLFMRVIISFGSANGVDPLASNELFVAQCESIGMFTSEALDDLATTSKMQG